MSLAAIHPVHRSIFVADIENSTGGTNADRARMREDLYAIWDDAISAARIPATCVDQLLDRGDGFLALFYPWDEVPMTTILGSLIPEMARRVASLPSESVLRVRVAVHEGGILYDRQGCFGEEVDVACRLLHSPAVKLRLARVSSPLVLAITDSVYQSVVLQDYEGIEASTFEPTRPIRVGNREVPAWTHVPSGT